MYVKLLKSGNSMWLALPKSLIRQYKLNVGKIELKMKENGIMIVPGKSEVAPLKDWDRLFTEAKATGFNADKDAAEFAEWDALLADGIGD